MAAYFVSDLHLLPKGNGADERTSRFVRFLSSLLQLKHEGGIYAPTDVFLVGDVFDLWVGGHGYFREVFADVVEGVKALVLAGVRVHYFEGNHDLHLARFWEKHVGAKVYADGANFELEGMKVRVEHGDMINPDDKGYLFLRSFLRTRVMTFLSHNLPGSVARAIGERASIASRDYTSNSPRKARPQEDIRHMIRRHAEVQFKQTPFDLIITGHVHVLDDHEGHVGSKKYRSVNLGSWFDEPRAFRLGPEGGQFIPV